MATAFDGNHSQDVDTHAVSAGRTVFGAENLDPADGAGGSQSPQRLVPLVGIALVGVLAKHPDVLFDLAGWSRIGRRWRPPGSRTATRAGARPPPAPRVSAGEDARRAVRPWCRAGGPAGDGT